MFNPTKYTTVYRVRSLLRLGRTSNVMDRRSTDNQEDTVALNVVLKQTEERH